MPPLSSDLEETGLTLPTRLGKWFRKELEAPSQNIQLISSPLRYIITYGIWVASFRVITLTFITYFIISPVSRLQDISDAYSSNEVALTGLSAFFYLLLLYRLNPLTTTPLAEIVTREQIEKSFLPGFVQGAFFAGGLILAFLLSGNYRYLGYFIQFEEAPFELANVLLRTIALGALVYCEEFIFRHKIPRLLKGLVPDSVAFGIIALCYCGIKILQFDLGMMQLLTLFLASLALSYRAKREGQFTRGAGFWAAILIVFHPLLSLPLFGNDFSGILLVKYQAAASTRLLSGGAGGPLSSFAFQLLLILDIGRSILRRKK